MNEAERGGRWMHNWVPLDAEALKEKHHGHVPAGAKPGMTHHHGPGLPDVPPGHALVYNVDTGRPQVVSKAEAAAGHQRYGARTFKAGSPARGEVDKRALALAREAKAGSKPAVPGLPEVRKLDPQFYRGSWKNPRTSDLMQQAKTAADSGDFDRAVGLVSQASGLEASAGVQSGAGTRKQLSALAGTLRRVQAVHELRTSQAKAAGRHDAYVETTREICRSVGLRLDC